MKENSFKVSEHSLKTAISKVEPNKIVTRGYNQRDLIEKIRYSDMVYLLLKGKLPTLAEGKLFNHILVSFCDHGATPPSTQTARLISSSGSPLNAAVAGALLSFGHKHAGAIEKTMEVYQSGIDSLNLTGDADLDNTQIASLAIDIFCCKLFLHTKICDPCYNIAFNFHFLLKANRARNNILKRKNQRNDRAGQRS